MFETIKIFLIKSFSRTTTKNIDIFLLAKGKCGCTIKLSNKAHLKGLFNE